MNFGLRFEQMLAERSDLRKMNIIQKTALRYRLERIGAWPEPTPVEETTELQWEALKVLRQELEGMKVYLKKKAYDKKKSNRYNKYT